MFCRGWIQRIYLPESESAFDHGQLYVAFSRAWYFANITMLMKDREEQDKREGVCHTKNEVNQEMLTSVHSVAVDDVQYLREYQSGDECEVSDVESEDVDMDSGDANVVFLSEDELDVESDNDEAVLDENILISEDEICAMCVCVES